MPRQHIGSFDYKVINPTIKNILKARSELNNTVQVAMPFVKATTTIRLPEFLGEGCIGFTLGLHAINENVFWENMYAENESNGIYPLVGYTTQYDFQTGVGKPKKIYTKPPTTEVSNVLQLFDQGLETVNTSNFGRIPPPGITQVKIGRNKNGLLAAGEINFSVPSLPQLEILHRTFLIPGCGVILEWGQQFAAELNPSPGEFTTSTNIAEHMFPWHDVVQLQVMLHRIAKREIGLPEILENYVYPTQGQYMWMFGRIVNFSTKANSDGSFDCNVKILGPSEDAWAYSTRSTIVPASDASKNFCTADAKSVESYFNTTAPGWNLKSVLDGVLSGGILPNWKAHVQKLPKGNKSDGDKENKTDKSSTPNVSENNFAESEDAYFFTWKFFVNVIINDPTNGLKALFSPPNLTPEKAATIGLLRPYSDNERTNVLAASPGNNYINDPTESYVGYNKYLRSIDPSVMIIVHEKAAELSKKFLEQNRPGDADTVLKATDKSGEFLAVGDFQFSTTKAAPDEEPPLDIDDPDRGFLSAGVWLNHKTVCTSMIGGDTVLRGITNLLERMNSATMGYWQLSLDISEPLPNADGKITTNNQHSYTVIDANWRGTSDEAVKKAIDGGEGGEPGLYVFNKYIRRTPTGELVGSELTECTVDLSLPKRMFSQIATLGLVQKEDLAKAGVTDEPATGEKSTLIADPNETLREMFAITSLSVKDKERGPDLTILPFGNNPPNQCGQANTATTAMTAGTGQKVGGQNVDALPKDASKSNLEDSQKKANEILSSELCTQKCAQSTQSTANNTVPGSGSPVAPPGQPVPPGAETITYPGQSGNTVTVTIDKNNKGTSANAQALYAAGYRNGITTDNFKSIGGGHRLYPDSADAFLAMKAAAEKDGVPLNITDSFRPLYGGEFSQVGCVQKKGFYSSEARAGYSARQGQFGWCAKPGTSNHGWGLAVDLNSKAVGSSGQTAADWLTKNAKRFGFKTIPNEPWHWEYTIVPLKQPIPQVTAKTPTPTPAVPVATTTPASTPAPAPQANAVPVPTDCAPCVNAQQVVKQATAQLDIINSTEKLVREFPHLEQIFRYIEPFPDVMVTAIRTDANGNKANAFGAAPGSLSLSADLEMPGINGMRIGELFWIDRIPAFYRAFGAFQIMSIEDTIGIDGWKTRIESRFNYLGNTWKTSVYSLLTKKG